MDARAEQAAFPRVTIEYCTRCKWMLRAAYYAQELLSTFEASLGEVSLRPASSGTFKIHITADPSAAPSSEPPSATSAEHPFADADDEGPPLFPRSSRASTSARRPSATPHTTNAEALTSPPRPAESVSAKAPFAGNGDTLQPAPEPQPTKSGRRPSAVAHTDNPELAHALGDAANTSTPQGMSGRRRRPSAIAHTEHPELGDALRRVSTNTRTLWDRRVDGGFPETKELKRRVRDVIEPGRNLGHVDGKAAGRHEGGKTCEVGCKDCE